MKPDAKYDSVELPVQIVFHKKLLEQLIEHTKKQTDMNMQLVNLGGNCPDEKLLETGRYQEGKTESFEEKKSIDSVNQGRPETM